jgi:hypothetical protein
MSQRRQRLALIGLALAFGAIGAVLKAAQAPAPVLTATWMVAGAIGTAVLIVWWSLRAGEVTARAAIDKHHAMGGVPCAVPADTPAWGTLVVTSTSFVWEPDKRALAAGHHERRIDHRDRASTTFDTVLVGIRRWPAVIIAVETGAQPALTLAMSTKSAKRLRQLLAANPNESDAG